MANDAHDVDGELDDETVETAESGDAFAAVRRGMDALCAEIDLLPNPLRDLWLALDVSHIDRVLRTLGLSVERMLRDFGAPSPRRPNRATANHLRRALAAVSDRRHHASLMFLTQPVIHSARHEGAIGAIEEWGEDLCRLALTAAALCRHLDRQWVPTAVRALIEVELLPDAWAGHASELEMAAEALLDAVVVSRAEVDDGDYDEEDYENDAINHDYDEVQRIEVEEEVAAVETAQLPAWARDRLADYRRAIGTAQAVAAAALSATESGCPPTTEAGRDLLTAAMEARRAAKLIGVALARTGKGAVPDDQLEALEQAVGDIAASIDPTAGAVRRLSGVSGPTGADSVIQALHEVATSPEQRPFALALVDLIDAAASGAGPLRIAELDGAARRSAPPALASAVVLAATGHLLLPGPAGTGTSAGSPSAGSRQPLDGPGTEAPTSTGPRATEEGPDARIEGNVGSAAASPTSEGPDAAVSPGFVASFPVPAPDADIEETGVGNADGTARPMPARPLPPPIEPRTPETEAASPAAPAEPASSPAPSEPVPIVAAAPPGAPRMTPKRPPAVPVDAGEDDAEDDAESEGAAASEELMLAALDQRRFALAWWASAASGDPAPLLRLTALGAAVSISSGPAADALREMTLGLSRRDYGPFPGIQVLAAVAAVRAALVAPDAGTSSVALDLARMLGLPGLSALAEAVSNAASRGVMLAGDTMSGLVDADRLDTRIRERSVAASELLRRERRFSFQRASDIWKQWTAPAGLLGAVLGPVAANDRARVNEVAAAAEALSARGTIERALRDTDGRLRGSGSKRIEGSARNTLLHEAAEAAQLARDWCNDVTHSTRSHRDAGWLDAPTAKLRSSATAVEAEVRNELRGTATDPFSEAAASAAAEVLDDVFELLAGQPPSPRQQRPELILGLDLLVGDTRVGADLEPTEPLRADRLAPALERSLPEAFSARSARGDHLASGLIVEVLDTTDPDTGEILGRRRAEEMQAAEARTTTAIAAAREMLDQARRQLYVSEDRYADLSARVEGAARSGRVDFDAVDEELSGVDEEVSTAREIALAVFLSGLEAACALHPGVAGTRDRIATLAATDLATASEWLALAIEGRSLTDTSEAPFRLAEIWPAVAEVVGAGIDDGLVDDLAARHDHGALRFSALPVDSAERATSALRKWRRISRGAARRSAWLDELRPILRLLGIDADGVDANAGRLLPSSPQRQWIELTGVVRPGKTLVPTFGSKAGSRLRVLVAFGAPTEATLLEWATPDNSDRPVIVFHVGTLPLEFRTRFATACRERRSRPEIAIIDDTVLAWAAARGEFRFEFVMRAVLPFVATNPYLPPSGDCPPELFYGRSEARRALVDTQGSCLLYGGRQLGKSALLRSTVRDFGDGAGQVACYIDLKPASIGSTRRADVVWEMLWSRLGEHGVTPAGRGAGRDPAAKVAEAVRSYLGGDEGRRILVALDECDEFFDVDAATNFATTSRLKDLMDHTGRRFKVVWAGLHQVARFANIPNQPLAHLGRPIAIGPLDPSAAHRLIAEPMRALGIDFARPDLVNRVLAYCNYQPVLLHLFGQALVEQMLFPPQLPVPVVVHAADVEAVASAPSLQHEIRERFELTLGLDPRYRVIAYTVAYEAHIRGVEVALSASELRAACERWWPAGFASLDPAEFRALLEEMASLGVLAGSTSVSGWRLRSPNVLRMLGTVSQVEDRLLEEETREPTWLVTTEARRVLPDKRRSPVTEGQLADLVGEGRNQVRVVIGSAATCVDSLADAVRSVAEATGRFRLRLPGKLETFSRHLIEGTVGEHFVVLSDLRGVGPDSFAKSLSAASARVPAKGGTRSVMLVADASNFDALAELFNPAGGAVAGVEVTPLRRLDLRGLGAWALEVESAFQDDEARRRLAEITGGWPVLLEEAAALARAGRSTATIIAEMSARMAGPDGAGALVDSVGLSDGGPLVGLIEVMVSSPGASLSSEDLEEFIDDYGRPPAVVAMLRMLGVLEPAPGAEGELRMEPVLSRCWESATHSAGSDS